MFAPHSDKTINLEYKSKYNRKHESQVVLLMITNGKKWHYIALKSEPTDDGFNLPIKSLSRLFRGVTSNHVGDFYCLNCLHSFRTDKKHERLCDNNDYCGVEMPVQFNKTLKYNYGEKSLKLVSNIFYQIFISHQIIALQKLRKILFVSPKKLFSFSRYSNFCISIFPSFSPCQPLFRG